VPSAFTGSGAQIKALQSEIHNIIKQHNEDFTLVKQQLSQLSDDNKQLPVELMQMKRDTAAEACNNAAGASDSAHEYRHQCSHSAAQERSVLARDEVLDTVFSFVGIGEYYYVAGVCRNWRGRYMTLCQSKTTKYRDCDHTHNLCTSYTRAVTTAEATAST
jgi:hypothetical protein